MASTRSNNTPGDYNQQQSGFRDQHMYMSYVNSASGAAAKPAMPDIGVMPSGVDRSTYASNAIDIESELRGTGCSNLVAPKAAVVCETRELGTMSFFERPVLTMPEPMVTERFQRPNRG